MSQQNTIVEQMSQDTNTTSPTKEPYQVRIIDIWEDNFFEEFERIVQLVPEYGYIAMDTEFPGIVEVPRTMTTDYQYQLLKLNVDKLKLIQLGITLFDKDGNVPPGP